MSVIIAIDPGPTSSGVVTYRPSTDEVLGAANLDNEAVLARLDAGQSGDVLVIEEIKSYGMIVGAPVFDTVRWSGRFQERWGRAVVWMPRKTAVANLCGTVRAGNSNVRAAIEERFPATGGGARPACGTKKEPGPLYTLKEATGAHVWQAFALALTYIDMIEEAA